MEQALATERSQLQSLFDGVDSLIYVADPVSYELLYANGYLRDHFDPEPLGKLCYKVLQDRDTPCPFCTNDKIFGEYMGRSYTWEFQNEVTRRWFRCVDKAITWSDGRLVRFELASDITDERRMDQQRIQLEKLGSLGQLTAGVAHELNNPLMGIINSVQYCLEELPDDHDCHEVLTDAEHQTRRCMGIVHGLLAFSRSGDDSHQGFRRADPRDIAERVIRLLDYRSRKEHVKIALDAAPDLGEVVLQPERFEQLLVNLMTNALDAVGDSDHKDIGIRLARDSGRFITEVSDTGPGIPDTVRERIFEPFFTTKPIGKGTGLLGYPPLDHRRRPWRPDWTSSAATAEGRALP